MLRFCAALAGIVGGLAKDGSFIVEFQGSDELAEAGNGIPVVMMHGMGDFANNPMGMVPLRKLIAKTADAYVHSVELCSDPAKLSGCDTEDQSNGFFMTMDEQVDQFARVVRADKTLSGGFNAIGFSQGNTVIRGYIHKYNDPPVKSFVSMHGVMMGVNGLPQCPMNVTGVGILCRTVDAIVSHAGVYTGYVQNHLAQANYFRDAENLETYRSHGHFLPYINNEVKGKENTTYTENFKSLEKLVLVMAEDDTMVHPKESEHFGFFKDGSRTELVAMKDAPWYQEDWFGLKSLDEAKKIDFHSTPGNHLRFKEDFLLQMVKTYFVPAADVSIVV
mmetsp:Transcript_96490/g.171555  ORF Transcript_96490/g.171555 Transcript_96490/m.171555 type:complete len:333 (-) Transcript_96490:256-1254(-)|eukprot:CAMPEP_0197637460 /NCGR_PEP_ID=MMETSP1338-20131121/12684_1 /TAXON_ID=43686 ORGANISM="Pelagodinium beii, Strain RCC1491" /NCGR_SAMPLE_ID=MMETSP1338 /ASSEMBLY_ACC=CAM_ASM_000754 /LENGTH=332 /DNA_ID=CAMNT_0043209889 /DNA_START=88 /DNA_END=1086 /DNA_ORIENTATION=-